MKTWLVNTNSNSDNGNPNGFKFMLRQNKVAAYYDNRSKIDKIAPGDLVLLYHNQNRVIAVGFAIDNPSHDFKDAKAIEHWIDVNWIWKSDFNDLFEPLNAINRNDLRINMVNNTVVNISSHIDFYALLNKIGQRQKFEI